MRLGSEFAEARGSGWTPKRLAQPCLHPPLILSHHSHKQWLFLSLLLLRGLLCKPLQLSPFFSQPSTLPIRQCVQLNLTLNDLNGNLKVDELRRPMSVAQHESSVQSMYSHISGGTLCACGHLDLDTLLPTISNHSPHFTSTTPSGVWETILIVS